MSFVFPNEHQPFIASRSGRTHTRPEDIRSSRERASLAYIARVERNTLPCTLVQEEQTQNTFGTPSETQISNNVDDATEERGSGGE